MPQHTTRRVRQVAALAVATAVGVSLAACSSGSGGASASSSAKEPQTFSFAFSEANTSDTSARQVADAFMKAHPGVTIQFQKLPAESYAQAIATRIQGGNAPDAFEAESGIGQADSIQPFAKAGLLLELANPQIKTDLAPAGIDQFSYGGKVYAVSRGSGVNGIIYNDVAAKGAGISLTGSSTFNEVLNGCAAAKAKGKSLFGLAGSIPANTSILAHEIATSTVYGPDPKWNAERNAGKVKFATTQGWTDALNAIKTLSDKGCFQPGAGGAGFDALTNGSSSGKLFGFFAPGGAAASIEAASGGHVKLTVLPFPAPAGVKTYASVSSDEAIAASAKTKSPKLVEEFLAYIASPEGQKIISTGTGFPIGSKDASQLPSTYQDVAPVVISGDTRSFPPLEWANGKVNDDLGAGIQGILNGQKTAAQVLQQMDTDWG
ncbi:MAG TPA: extracellular solute-binding protein [Amnibacterium sp.]|uniref:ABC transporter substrate-binding protein n=1 Tax=Amnibacterium sp. TaxID=1872496 RepID=UPI002F942E27